MIKKLILFFLADRKLLKCKYKYNEEEKSIINKNSKKKRKAFNPCFLLIQSNYDFIFSYSLLS